MFSEAERVYLSKLFSARYGLFWLGRRVIWFRAALSPMSRMRMFNPDGPEAQTCGNGFSAWRGFASERLGKEAFAIETGKGVSQARREAEMAPGVATYAVEIGPLSTDVRSLPLLVESQTLLDAVIPALSPELRFTAISAPNPHLVAIWSAKWTFQSCRNWGGKLPRFPRFSSGAGAMSASAGCWTAGVIVATFERGAD